MRKPIVGIALALALVAAIVVPAAAITYGAVDSEHPYVGLVGFFDDQGNWLWRCSGTLLSPTVFLTAAHCVSPDPDTGDTPDFARLWFTATGEGLALDPLMAPEDAQCRDYTAEQLNGYPCESLYWGEPIANPEYAGIIVPDTHDIGLVMLDTPVTDPAVVGQGFGVLPTAGYLDHLATQRHFNYVTFTSVGYGLNDVYPVTVSLRTRYYSVSHLVSLKSTLTGGYSIQTSNNPGNWPQDPDTPSGGTCFGDSGGPLFITGSNVVVGITSFGMSSSCSGTDFAYRTDSDSARSFLTAHGVAVP
jgi:hypothetical protein